MVPGSIRGEPVQFTFGTNSARTCKLYQSYVEDRGLPVSGIGTLRVFGQTCEIDTARVSGNWRGWQPPVAGRLGSYLLWDSIVAVDASVPAIAYAPADQRAALPAPLSRIRLIPKTWKGMCYTDAIPGAVFSVAYEYGTNVTKAYVAAHRLRPGRNGRVHVELRLPGNVTVAQEVAVIDEMPVAPLADAGITRCDGILGSDFLCRWITVFDFPAGELLLFSYD